MSLNLIDLLKQHVLAIVLEGDNQDLVAKNEALSNFFPLLLTILQHKPELIAALQNNLNPTLLEIFDGNVAIKNQFLQQVSRNVSATAIASVLERSITPTLTVLAEQAGTQDSEGIQFFLQKHSADIQKALPDWALALMAGLGLNIVSPESLGPVSAIPEPQPVQERKVTPGWLISLLGLLIFALLVGLLLRACDKKTEEAVSSVAPVEGNQPAMFQISTGDQGELVTCRIYSGDLQYIEILQNEVKQIFNHPNGCGVEHQTQYQQRLINQDALPTVLKLLKGVPNTVLTWQGEQIFVQSENSARAQAIAPQIQRLTPNVKVQVMQPQRDAVQTMKQNQLENATVYDSVARAEQALAQLDINQVQPLDIATALNLQIINFSSGSAEIPQLNHSVLSQAAALIQRVPNVHVTILGHTDAEGDAVMNKSLSQKRARAVADYLIAQGVDPSKVTAFGYGEEQPIADNTTEEGKFKNRRIEFKVENTETGKVREVDEAGVNSQKTE